MKRSVVLGIFAAVASMMALVSPALAHGDHDARPLARDLAAGPHSISLWQVYPDVNAGMNPHLIVLFDGEAARPAADISVAVNATPMVMRPSTTTANGWETTEGVAEGDVVTIAISEGAQTWDLGQVVVPPPTTSMLPMQELIYVSIFLTVVAALWTASRTARAWRRPAAIAR